MRGVRLSSVSNAISVFLLFSTIYFYKLCSKDYLDRKEMSDSTIYSWPKVILFGDSITQYGFSKDGTWAAIIADKLQRKCDVLNRGFSGYNTRWCRAMLPQLVTKNDVNNIAALVLFLGANDGNLPASGQHVPVDEYSQNLEAMIQYLMEIGLPKNKIILAGPPPVNEEAWAIEAANKGKTSYADNKYKQQYALASRSVAAHIGCTFVDTYMNFMKNSDWKEMLVDGLHFSAKGSHTFESLLWPHVEALTKNLPMIMPHWGDIDPKHWEASLQSKNS